MRSTVWLGAAVVALGIFFSGCGIKKEVYERDVAKLKVEIDRMMDELDQTKKELITVVREKNGLEQKLAELNAELQYLASERDRNANAAAQAKKRLATFRQMLERFQAMVKSGKLKIKIVNNKMIVEMASAILFDSGQAKLSEEGEIALTEVAAILADIQDRTFQVAGHTDDVPVGRGRRFKSNWQLSSNRAVAVVNHLIENGMRPENLSAAGYGDTQPAAPNDTEEGRAQNRRIEIVLQPNLDELPDLSSLESMI
jgi:chemotaxis protein MotB